MLAAGFTLHPYLPADEDAAIELWRRAWQEVFPDIDFSARRDWWRERWRAEIVPTAAVTVARRDGRLVGFVTVDCSTGYLDQMVVAPEHWGTGVAQALLVHAKRLSPSRLDLTVNRDNPRAIRFYEKNGFVTVGEDVNPNSGRPIYRMSWRP